MVIGPGEIMGFGCPSQDEVSTGRREWACEETCVATPVPALANERGSGEGQSAPRHGRSFDAASSACGKLPTTNQEPTKSPQAEIPRQQLSDSTMVHDPACQSWKCSLFTLSSSVAQSRPTLRHKVAAVGSPYSQLRLYRIRRLCRRNGLSA